MRGTTSSRPAVARRGRLCVEGSPCTPLASGASVDGADVLSLMALVPIVLWFGALGFAFVWWVFRAIFRILGAIGDVLDAPDASPQPQQKPKPRVPPARPPPSKPRAPPRPPPRRERPQPPPERPGPPPPVLIKPPKPKPEPEPVPLPEPEPMSSAMLRRTYMEALFKRDDFRCGICGKKLPLPERVGGDIQIDHIYPRHRGGTDGLDNLQLAHRNCNRSKSDRNYDLRHPDLPTFPADPPTDDAS